MQAEKLAAPRGEASYCTTRVHTRRTKGREASKGKREGGRKDGEPERGGSNEDGDRRKAFQNGDELSEAITPVEERLRERRKKRRMQNLHVFSYTESLMIE